MLSKMMILDGNMLGAWCELWIVRHCYARLIVLMTVSSWDLIGFTLKRAHWCTAMAMSRRTLPVRYMSMPMAAQYSQLYLRGSPFKSLFKNSFPTGVMQSLVLPSSIPSSRRMRSIGNGWVKLNEVALSCLISTPRYLSIDPSSSVKTDMLYACSMFHLDISSAWSSKCSLSFLCLMAWTCVPSVSNARAVHDHLPQLSLL